MTPGVITALDDDVVGGLFLSGTPGDFPLAKMTISRWHYWRFKPGIIGGFHLAFLMTFKLALTGHHR
ncbi:MAG: hypothetical protein C7B46_14960 [Sulfobacillus benefaciens]|uniref:Uncharacterized protein n=1 Tax=Sulfobacillus benefaciens TaxID=453960 RepID=A0A2T2XCT0_9FIRM|nr:MAG: hypothetical protein C7B46_14960 [Sulfobacillus benefaciens]